MYSKTGLKLPLKNRQIKVLKTNDSLMKVKCYMTNDDTPAQIPHQGSYRQVCVKFKDFSRTSNRLSYCFQGLKTYKNTDLHDKIVFLKC